MAQYRVRGKQVKLTCSSVEYLTSYFSEGVNYMHTHEHAHTICTHKKKIMPAHTHAHICIRTHTRLCAHTHTHTHTHTHIHTHTHTHTHMKQKTRTMYQTSKASKCGISRRETGMCGIFFPFGLYYVMLESVRLRLVRAHAHMSNRAFCRNHDTFLYCFGLLHSFTPADIPVTRWSVWMSLDPQPHIYCLGIWVKLTGWLLLFSILLLGGTGGSGCGGREVFHAWCIRTLLL